jgi:hypothetical protein
MDMLEVITKCFLGNQVFYSAHARREMREEELGEIKEQEVFNAIRNGEVIEDYPDDKPYPSALVIGFSESDKPLHIVCAYDSKDNLVIVVTAYRPDPNKWIKFRSRRRT